MIISQTNWKKRKEERAYNFQGLQLAMLQVAIRIGNM